MLIEHDMTLVDGIAHKVIALDRAPKSRTEASRGCNDSRVIEAYLGKARGLQVTAQSSKDPNRTNRSQRFALVGSNSISREKRRPNWLSDTHCTEMGERA